MTRKKARCSSPRLSFRPTVENSIKPWKCADCPPRFNSSPEVKQLLEILSWLGDLTLKSQGINSKCSAQTYGSSRSGFYDPETSDIDVAIIAAGPWDDYTAEEQTKFSLKFLQVLEGVIRRHFSPSDKKAVTVNKWARIPVLYLYDVLKGNGSHGFPEVNVVFGFNAGIYNSDFLHAYANIDQQLFHVGQSIKKWVKALDLVSTEKNNFSCISSYAWVLMVVFYFQVSWDVPCLQTVDLRADSAADTSGIVGSMNQRFYGQDEKRDTRYVNPKIWFKSERPEAVSNQEALAGFFHFYSKKFNPETMTVDIRNPSRGMRERLYFDVGNGGRFLAIADPFEQRNLVKGLTEKGWKKISEAIKSVSS